MVKKDKNVKQEVEKNAKKIADFLVDHKVEDVVVVDLSEKSSFTDAFVIGTVNSVGHLRGVVHQLWGELIDLGIEVNNRHKSPSVDGWELIDGGDIIIHLMSKELRDFYDLEKLWNKTREIEEESDEE